jgi:hypothetical protein
MLRQRDLVIRIDPLILPIEFTGARRLQTTKVPRPSLEYVIATWGTL